MPRMERRKRPLRSSLHPVSVLSAVRDEVGWGGGLLEPELLFENGLVGDGDKRSVLFGFFGFWGGASIGGLWDVRGRKDDEPQL